LLAPGNRQLFPQLPFDSLRSLRADVQAHALRLAATQDGLNDVRGEARQTEHTPHVRSIDAHRLGQVVEARVLALVAAARRRC